MEMMGNSVQSLLTEIPLRTVTEHSDEQDVRAGLPRYRSLSGAARILVVLHLLGIYYHLSVLLYYQLLSYQSLSGTYVVLSVTIRFYHLLSVLVLLLSFLPLHSACCKRRIRRKRRRKRRRRRRRKSAHPPAPVHFFVVGSREASPPV